jgi:hypothetical protein
MRRFGALLALAALLAAVFFLTPQDMPKARPNDAAGIALPTPTSQPQGGAGAAIPTPTSQPQGGAGTAIPTPTSQPQSGAGIAFVGDSVTLGWYASTVAKTYFSLVSQTIDERVGPRAAGMFISIDPVNDLAVAAEAARQNSQFIIIELGVHFMAMDGWTPDAFRDRYASLLDCVVGDSTIVVAGTIPWLGWKPGSLAYVRAEIESRIIAEEAAKRQVAVADLWSAMRLRPELVSRHQDGTFLWPFRGDNTHPGDAGHAVIAWMYVKALAEEIANPPQRPYERQCR